MTKSLEDLEQEHGVKARVAGHKFSLNYDQIESREGDKLAQECRGLILTPVKREAASVPTDVPLGETRVLARPFNRFFNLGQGAAASVDLEHAETRFFEKMDGTLCILYYDWVKKEWHIATRSVPEADLPIDGFEETYTFRTLFERALKETTDLDFQTFCLGRCKEEMTFMFELTTPANRIVVDYADYRVTLLGVRHNASGIEYDPVEDSKYLGVPHAQVYRFGSLAEMVDFVSSRAPQDHEGVVVCDSQFRRIKVKNAGYLALNRIKDSATKSPRALVELILLDKLDDAMPLLPDHIKDRAVKLQETFRGLFERYRTAYQDCAKVAETEGSKGSHEHRRAFALAVQAHKDGWMAPMMLQYQGRIENIRNWIEKNRLPNGRYGNSFLDGFMYQLEKV
jgi:T4 RnlA family RNA ligase